MLSLSHSKSCSTCCSHWWVTSTEHYWVTSGERRRFGLVFHVLTASPNIPRVELVEVHRQARSSGIPHIAREIRRGMVPPLPPFAGPGVGVSFIEAGDGEVMDHILGVLTHQSGCDDAQILGVTKRGASGIRNINATLHAMASATKPKLEGWGFTEEIPLFI